MRMEEVFQKQKICAILRNVPMDSFIPYAQAVFQGGIGMFEVAMNSEGAAFQIAELRKLFGEQAFVGAGTVVCPECCEKARQAGAQFLLSPSVNEAVLEFCKRYELPILPGVMTPTDVSVCLLHGIRVMKLFPAGDLPETYIKSLKGPFPQAEFVAVGGVTPDNVADFLKAGYLGAGMGSNLVPKQYLYEKNWNGITKAVETLMAKAAC